MSDLNLKKRYQPQGAAEAVASVAGLDVATYPVQWKNNCVNRSGTDDYGRASFLEVGDGLSVNIIGEPQSVECIINESYCRVSNDMGRVIGDLADNRINYLWFEKPAEGIEIEAFGSSIILPKYGTDWGAGVGFPYVVKNRRSLLHFDGADGSTTITDEAGLIWTAVGNAQLDTAQFKFGTASLLLDGAGDYISTASLIKLPRLQWTRDFWIRIHAFPGAAAGADVLWSVKNAANYGMIVGLNNTGGVYKLKVWISSNGTSWDVVSGGLGTKTDWALDTWYHIEIVFDGPHECYKIYVDGVLDYTEASALEVCAFTSMVLGYNPAVAQYFDGWIDESKMIDHARHIEDFTPPTAAYAGIAEDDEHWYDVWRRQMMRWSESEALWEDVDRIFIGKVLAQAGVVPSVIQACYALKKRYAEANIIATGGGDPLMIVHNIGIPNGFIHFIVTTYGQDPFLAKPAIIDVAGTNGLYLYTQPGYERNAIHIKLATNPTRKDDNTGWETSGFVNIMAESMI